MLRSILDSCAFDELLSDPNGCDDLRRAIAQGEVKLLSTHVQRDELAATPDEAKRSALLTLWATLTNAIPTTGAVWGSSRWDEASWFGNNVDRFDSVLRTPANGTKDRLPGHTNDALIIETALQQGATFVTAEKGRAAKVARSVGVTQLTVAQLLDMVRERDKAAS